MPRARPHLKLKQILIWADAHHARTGDWPTAISGCIPESDGETWSAVTSAFARGKRGLPRDISLAGLLFQERDVRSKQHAPALTVGNIVAWARSHRKHKDSWPDTKSGPVQGAAGENWRDINVMLRKGGRGLPGGDSLAKLLARRCGVPNERDKPPLTVAQILKWADLYHDRHNSWPNRFSKSVVEMRGTRWSLIESALYHGLRGLPGRQTIPQLLAEHRGVRNLGALEPLSVTRILQWADAHRKRFGKWPNQYSGEVHGSPGETWARINGCLKDGHRGLPEGESITTLLIKHRDVPSKAHRPRYTHAQILKWADAFHQREARWPRQSDGPIPEAPDETWSAVHAAFARGIRGLSYGASFAALLERERGVRNPVRPPPLSFEKILSWADAHRSRTGDWPHIHTGRIQEDPGETWNAVNIALALGARGLKGGSSLNKFLVKRRGKRDLYNPPPLSFKLILQWADAHYEATGQWPSRLDGRVMNQPDEKWSTLNSMLKRGKRGLPPKWTIVKLLKKFRADQYVRGGAPLSDEQILDWITLHHELTGQPPTADSGAVIDEAGENWKAIDVALRHGSRNLRGRSSLERLMASRYEPYKGIGQSLSVEKIQRWAADFKDRVGSWPTVKSAYVFPRPHHGERWSVIDRCLREGRRGLKGGTTLARVLREGRAAGRVKTVRR